MLTMLKMENAGMPQLEMIRGRIRERLQATGLSGNEASKRANLGLSYVNDLLSGKSKAPVIDRLARLAAVLGCDVDYLLGKQETPIKGEVLQFPSGGRAEEEIVISPLPLFSVSLTDPDGFFTMLDDEAGNFVPLASIVGDANAYAVSVADDLMSPRYLPGETVIVSSRKPISAGAYVVVRLNDDRAMIRQVVEISSTEIKLCALKTGAKTKISRADLKSIHRVVACCNG